MPTYKTKLHFLDASDERIRPGLTANITIITDSRTDILAIPERIISKESGVSALYVLTEDGERIRRIEITTGLRSSDGLIEVTKGLKAGDRVITSPVP